MQAQKMKDLGNTAPDLVPYKREIWCDWSNLGSALGPSPEEIHSALTSIDAVILKPDQLEPVLKARAEVSANIIRASEKKMLVACQIDSLEQATRLDDRTDVILSQNRSDILKLKDLKKPVGTVIDVTDAASMQYAYEMIPHVKFLILRFFTVETNIPLELLIAESQRFGTYVVKYVQSLGEALSARGVLEWGPRGICFSPRSPSEMAEAKTKIMYLRNTQLQMQEVEVIRAQHIGIGYRGCVDCTTMFEKDEGILVGSTSTGGILMCSEVHHLPFMDLRPFRVNAGAVHSYVWAPENKTHYITELVAGREVLAVNTSGIARPVQVGRTKIEIRSLRLIEAQSGDAKVNVIIQDDWHVRVFGADGSPINSTSIVPGTKLLAFMDKPGRHVGIQIDEYIAEQ